MNATTREIPAGLVAARDQVREELKRADAKATTLLSLVGALLAGVVALSARGMPLAASVTLWVAAAPIAGSVWVLLMAVRPRLGRHTAPVPGTWLYAAQTSPRGLLSSFGPDAAETAAADVCGIARIADAKYRRVQLAVSLLAVGLAVLALSLVLALAL